MAQKEPTGFKSWIFTTDHKRIAIMYLITTIVFLVVGLLLATVMRLHQLFPPTDMSPAAIESAIISPRTYNAFFTVHGVAMILYWIIPVLLGFFANYLIPLMIGAHDVAFPRLNALSFWFFVAASVMAVIALVSRVDIGWTGYPPYSLRTTANSALYVFAVHLLGASSLAGAVNFITTIITLRAPGMSWGRLNLAVWGLFGAFVIQLIGIPVLAAAVTMLLFDRYLGTSFYQAPSGGNPVLYQHLFWFYAHPAVYVVALPVFGITSEIISTFARKTIFGYTSMVVAIMIITVLGFEVWVHHLFTAGVVDWLRVVQTWLTVFIAIPTGIKIFNWLATLHKGSIEFNTPMLHALGFIGIFVIGGVTGVANGMLGFDIHVHDTYWVTGHFHFVLALSMTMLCLGGIYFWFPKFTGKMYNEKWGKIGFWLAFVGAIVGFFPHFILGLQGMPRRYWAIPPEFVNDFKIISVFSFIAIAGVVIALVNFLVSAIKGEKLPPELNANPWNAKSLEWTIPSPPPFYNFEHIPTITAGPYEYGNPHPEGKKAHH
jgi:cytochrome c oxidase subunit 1